MSNITIKRLTMNKRKYICEDVLNSLEDCECLDVSGIIEQIRNTLQSKYSRKVELVEICICRVDRAQCRTDIPLCGIELEQGKPDIFVIIRLRKKTEQKVLCVCVECKRGTNIAKIIERFKKSIQMYESACFKLSRNFGCEGPLCYLVVPKKVKSPKEVREGLGRWKIIYL